MMPQQKLKIRALTNLINGTLSSASLGQAAKKMALKNRNKILQHQTTEV